MWLVCTFNTTSDNYKEKMKFRYIDNEMYGFYREENFYRTNSESKNTIHETFNDLKENLELDSQLSYELTETDDNIRIDTYISVKTRKAIFDSFISDFKITYESDIKEVKNNIEAKNFKCVKKIK